jgi:predicted CopG family antitoxin
MNISIKEEAYEFLKSRKSGNKSFSDVILEFKEKKSPLGFFGILKDKDWTQTEKNIRSFREDFEERSSKTYK